MQVTVPVYGGEFIRYGSHLISLCEEGRKELFGDRPLKALVFSNRKREGKKFDVVGSEVYCGNHFVELRRDGDYVKGGYSDCIPPKLLKFLENKDVVYVRPVYQ